MSIRRNILFYGQGGAGKSTSLAQLGKWVWQTQGLRTRVINADGGGTESAFAGLLSKGIADIWDIDTWDNTSIFAIMDLATKGWWPLDLSIPNTPLSPPVKEWRKCPKCGGDTGASSFGMVAACKKCGEKFGPGVVLPVVREPLNGLEKVGLYVFEGFTAFGNMMLRALRTSDPAGGNVVKEGPKDEKGAPGPEAFQVASPGQAHYLMAQSYLAQFVANSRRIPVGMTGWSALEYRGDDEGKPIYGPQGPGKAITKVCIPWFTDVIHLDLIQKRNPQGQVIKTSDGQEVLERKFFLAPHFPPDNVSHKFDAKTSAPPGMPTVMPADVPQFFAELQKLYAKEEEGL